MKKFGFFSLILSLSAALTASAQDETANFTGDRTPAVTAKKKKKRAASAKVDSGADHEEGWIIERTKDGRMVKVPRKQTFVFKGSEVDGQSSRPSQTILGQRPIYRKTTLIPERSSFRREFYEASGYSSGRAE